MQPEQENPSSPIGALARIVIVGIGGAGCRMVNTMFERQLTGVTFVQIDTDSEEISTGQASEKIQLFKPNPSKSKRILAYEFLAEDIMVSISLYTQVILRCFASADLVVVLVGLGGATGSAAAPAIAQLAQQSGALTVGVAITPFEFEGVKRNQIAQEALTELDRSVDVLIQHSCHDLLRMIDPKISLAEAFLIVDGLACLSVKAFTDLVIGPNLVSFEFSELQRLFKFGGRAYVAVGQDDGEDRSRFAVRKAFDNLNRPSLLKNARGALMNITGGENLSLAEANEALHEFARIIQPGTQIVFGVLIDHNLGDQLRITLIVV